MIYVGYTYYNHRWQPLHSWMITKKVEDNVMLRKGASISRLWMILVAQLARPRKAMNSRVPSISLKNGFSFWKKAWPTKTALTRKYVSVDGMPRIGERTMVRLIRIRKTAA